MIVSKHQSGFTIVEMMVVVAVIGLLSAVAIPSYKKYMEKSKIAEGKIQLASAYTAMNSFYASYGMYANCLDYMGYNPMNEKNNRYYAVGFYETTDINSDAYTTAVNTSIDQTQCPQSMPEVFAVDATTPMPTQFSAGKGAASLIIDTQAEFESGTGAQDWIIGDQSQNQHFFTIGAVGSISSEIDTPEEASSMSINTNKFLQIHKNGY